MIHCCKYISYDYQLCILYNILVVYIYILDIYNIIYHSGYSSYPKFCWFQYIIHPHGARRSLNMKPATQRTIVVGRIFCSSLVELFWVNLGYIDRK